MNKIKIRRVYVQIIQTIFKTTKWNSTHKLRVLAEKYRQYKTHLQYW